MFVTFSLTDGLFEADPHEADGRLRTSDVGVVLDLRRGHHHHGRVAGVGPGVPDRPDLPAQAAGGGDQREEEGEGIG